MAYVIEVNKRDVSPYAEECPYAGEDGKGVNTSDHGYARTVWINAMIAEAKGEAEKTLDKIKKSL